MEDLASLSADLRSVLSRLTKLMGDGVERPATSEAVYLDTAFTHDAKNIFRFDEGTGEPDESAEFLIRRAQPPLPDPKLIRRIIEHRKMRSRHFGDDLFADPAWDMLLDLCAARAEHKRVSVTSLCIASGVAPTTALRWIKLLEEKELIDRIDDVTDRRRSFLSLSDKGARKVAAYFSKVEEKGTRLV